MIKEAKLKRFSQLFLCGLILFCNINLMILAIIISGSSIMEALF
jgi:hypothetical protein